MKLRNSPHHIIPALTVLIIAGVLIILFRGLIKVVTIGFIPLPYGYRSTVLVSLLLTLIYISMLLLMLNNMRKIKSVESQIGYFMSNVTTYLKTGATLYNSLSLASHNLKGYFKELIEKLLTLLGLGLDLNTAIEKVFSSVGREFKYVMKVLVIAERSGGKATDVLSEASTLLSRFYSFNEYKRRVFRQYFYLLIIVIAVYAFASTTMLLLLASVKALELPFMSRPDIELIYTMFYYISVIISLVSGVAYGKCVEGSVGRSAIYVLTISLINFTLMHLLPMLFNISLP